MKNTRRLKMEISALQNRYGRAQVVTPSDSSWLKICGFPLNPGQYNLPNCTILIIIPDHYDLAKIRECHVDHDLRLIDNRGRCRDLPHGHGWAEHKVNGYQWLCFEEPLGSNTGLIGFVSTLRAYFTDPHKYVEVNEE